jgi:hypothetical protein
MSSKPNPDGRARHDFAIGALKIGALALRHARTRIDVENIRNEGDRLLEELRQALDGHQRSVAHELAGRLSATGCRHAPPLAQDRGPGTGPVRLRDGTLAALLITDQATGIGERFAGLIDEPVSRLIVISPYWDPDLTALSDLTVRLAPADISVLLDPDTREFPKDAVGRLNGIRLYGRGNFRKRRYIHAKAIIAQTGSADHMLLGSANCTRAALGIGGFAGINEEVCLYRRLPPGSVLDTSI